MLAGQCLNPRTQLYDGYLICLNVVLWVLESALANKGYLVDNVLVLTNVVTLTLLRIAQHLRLEVAHKVLCEFVHRVRVSLLLFRRNCIRRRLSFDVIVDLLQRSCILVFLLGCSGGFLVKTHLVSLRHQRLLHVVVEFIVLVDFLGKPLRTFQLLSQLLHHPLRLSFLASEFLRLFTL